MAKRTKDQHQGKNIIQTGSDCYKLLKPNQHREGTNFAFPIQYYWPRTHMTQRFWNWTKQEQIDYLDHRIAVVMMDEFQSLQESQE
jgi:hypothetical protein